jgi:23S rRNA (cytidine1920-2'-O)/16S rRNA (cytidine1409-2'-O)-methyltransferase
MSKTRLDIALVDRGLADTRSKARALILAGDVLLNGAPALRAGSPVREVDDLQLKAKPRFVSRGGEKLDGALDAFDIDPGGWICADLGASTGGFTDVLLQRGAAKVYAVDVGYGQLDERIRTDSRVISMERTNARYLEELPEPVQFVVIDVSFISLSLILPIAAKILTPNGRCVPLIKPQFEAGKTDVGKGGVVRDPAIHRRVLENALAFAERDGFSVLGLIRSPLLGPSGNVEFLADLVRGDAAERRPIDALIDEVMAT